MKFTENVGGKEMLIWQFWSDNLINSVKMIENNIEYLLPFP